MGRSTVDFFVVAAVTAAVALGAISPGPSFIVVARTAVSSTAARARAVALGIGTGSVIFSVLAVTGISAVLVYAAWLFVALKVVGGAYLLWVGIKMWRRRDSALVTPARVSPGRAFWSGLVTQLSNPKTVIIYGSVFATLLPAHPHFATLLALPIVTTATEITWYVLVATALSLPGPQRLYARSATLIDRIAGSILGALGTAFAIDGVRQALR